MSFVRKFSCFQRVQWTARLSSSEWLSLLLARNFKMVYSLIKLEIISFKTWALLSLHQPTKVHICSLVLVLRGTYLMRSCKKMRRARATLMQEEGVETNFNNGSFQKQHEEEDRLSSLPDSLLITIISLLPINFAAATSVLSQRWRYLWTHTTHLFIDQTFDSREYFVTTLNHIISQLQSPKLYTFHLKTSLPNLPPNATIPFNSGLLIDQICLRNPEIFKLNLRFNPRFDDNFPITYCLFESQSLIELQLFANLEFNFLHDQMISFKFPNLKKLTLYLNASNCGLVGRNSNLFTACPLLEVLMLDFFFEDAISTPNVECLFVDIPTPNLKCLSISVSGDSVDCKFKIVAP